MGADVAVSDEAGRRRAAVSQVRRLAARAGLLAKEAGLDVDAAVLQQESDRQTAREAAVVVVGEAKRGKSSLINALVGRAGLLPVDADVATGTQVVLTAGVPEHARVFRGADDKPEDVGIDEFGAYVTAASPHVAGVTSVVVWLDSDLLREHLTLVDTPGVSGFVAAHAERTLMALSMADALLFVTDASAPITAPELQFLERVSERVGTVLFVVTKTDLERGWPTIVAENRKLLAEHAPAFADCAVFPVGSPLATPEDPDLGPEQIDELRRESGIPALRAALVESVARQAAALRLANACRLVETTMARVSEAESIRQRAAEHDPALREQLAEAEAKVQALASQGAAWRRKLTDDFQALHDDVQRKLQLETSRAIAALPEVAGDAEAEEIGAALAAYLQDHIQALWLRSVKDLADGAARISARLLEDLTVESGGIELPRATASVGETVPDVVWDRNSSALSPTATALDRWSVVQSGYVLSMMAATIAGPSGLGMVAAGVAGSVSILPFLIPGIVAATVLSRVRERERVRNEERSRAVDVARRLLADNRSDLANKLKNHYIKVLRTVDDEISGRLNARAEELKSLVAERQRIVSEGAARTNEVRAQAVARLAQAKEYSTLAANLRAGMRTGGLEGVT